MHLNHVFSVPHSLFPVPFHQILIPYLNAEQLITSVILIESLNYTKKRPYNRQKLILIWSAMGHFAEELRSNGGNVTYEITEDLEALIKAWIKVNSITELRIMAPNDRFFVQMIGNLNLSCQVTLVGNNHFMWGEEDFQEGAKSQKNLLMEKFYRAGRKRFWTVFPLKN